ncbi:hypothetical protein OJAV_G00216820 [Oryzias javanicus]|uniref:Uncharacterized protein n=1 Tax=Oryzias javanicus TaxID=123683 RepID=A0A3S2PPS0_ORYJA|nr:hypothetical protein OJAV_G00216820 [Oryzias javanicus]
MPPQFPPLSITFQPAQRDLREAPLLQKTDYPRTNAAAANRSGGSCRGENGRSWELQRAGEVNKTLSASRAGKRADTADTHRHERRLGSAGSRTFSGCAGQRRRRRARTDSPVRMTAHIPGVDSCYAADLTLRPPLYPPPPVKSRSSWGGGSGCVNTVPSGKRGRARAEGCTLLQKNTGITLRARPAAPLSSDSLLLRLLSCDNTPPPPLQLNGHTHFLAHKWSSSDNARRCNLRSKIPAQSMREIPTREGRTARIRRQEAPGHARTHSFTNIFMGGKTQNKAK